MYLGDKQAMISVIVIFITWPYRFVALFWKILKSMSLLLSQYCSHIPPFQLNWAICYWGSEEKVFRCIYCNLCLLYFHEKVPMVKTSYKFAKREGRGTQTNFTEFKNERAPMSCLKRLIPTEANNLTNNNIYTKQSCMSITSKSTHNTILHQINVTLPCQPTECAKLATSCGNLWWSITQYGTMLLKLYRHASLTTQSLPQDGHLFEKTLAIIYRELGQK